jgi:alpha-ribazole phosphatase
MRIDFVRHGATGHDGVMLGRSDWPATAEGNELVRRQTALLKWSAVVTSPLRRSREPAESIAAACGVTPTTDADWRELDFGHWDGRSRAAITAKAEGARALAAFYDDPAANPPPGGETWDRLAARVGSALQRACELPEPVLVVTHAGPIRAAIAQACGLPDTALWAFRIAYATRVRLDIGRDEQGRLWGEIVEIVQP